MGEADGQGRPGGASAALRANSPLLAVPHSLARYFFYNTRNSASNERPASLVASGLSNGGEKKRAGSKLDSLTGVSFPGKRSVPAYDLLPPFQLLGRRADASRAPARLYDVRFMPLEPIGPSGQSNAEYY